MVHLNFCRSSPTVKKEKKKKEKAFEEKKLFEKKRDISFQDEQHQKDTLLKTKKIDVDTHATRKPSENVVIYEKKDYYKV